MQKLYRVFLAAVLGASGAIAQTSGPNVRMAQFWSGLDINTQAIQSSSAVPNIGQSAHSVRLVLRTSGITSVDWSVQGVAVQGSDNGTTWFNIGPGVTESGSAGGGTGASGLSPVIIQLTGYGSYPYVRVSGTLQAGSGGTHGLVDGYYSGNSSPASVLADSFASGLSTSVVTVSATSPGAAVNITVGGTPTFYGVVLTGPGTVTRVVVGCQSGGVGTLVDINPFTSPFVLPASLRPYGQCTALSGGLQVIGYGSGTLTASVVYRGE